MLTGECDKLKSLWNDENSEESFLDAVHTHSSGDLTCSVLSLCIGPYIKNTESSTVAAIAVITERIFRQFKSWIDAKRSGQELIRSTLQVGVYDKHYNVAK